MSQPELTEAIRQLQSSYNVYMASLKSVLDFGESNIEPLIAALNYKGASPIAKALGLMMYAPTSEKSFPTLLKWLVAQSPLFPDVLEALVRAGDRPAHLVFSQIQEYANDNDDEAVRNLFHLATHFSDSMIPRLVEIADRLFDSENQHLRECAADVIWKVGHPHGMVAKEHLIARLECESVIDVRKSISDALERLK